MWEMFSKNNTRLYLQKQQPVNKVNQSVGVSAAFLVSANRVFTGIKLKIVNLRVHLLVTKQHYHP